MEDLALNFASNLGSFVVIVGVMLVYKRCTMCQSNCHTDWCDIKSPAWEQKKIELYKKAMTEFRKDTIREIKDGSSDSSPDAMELLLERLRARTDDMERSKDTVQLEVRSRDTDRRPEGSSL